MLGAGERHDGFTDLQYTAVNSGPDIASEFLANCRIQLKTSMEVKQIVHDGSIRNGRSTMGCSCRVPRQVKRSKRKAAFVVKKPHDAGSFPSNLFCHTHHRLRNSAKLRRPALTPRQWLPFTIFTMLLRL
jgi:hypothetical protein